MRKGGLSAQLGVGWGEGGGGGGGGEAKGMCGGRGRHGCKGMMDGRQSSSSACTLQDSAVNTLLV